MTRSRGLCLPGVLLALVALVLPIVPVFAVAAPSSVVFLSSTAYRHLAEGDDMLVVFHARIDYGGEYPTELASDTFIFRMYDTDGTTLLAGSRPYVFSVFDTNGYGDLVGSFYFPAVDAPAWGAQYQLNILGLPAYFNPSPGTNYTLAAADYSVQSTQEGNRLDLYMHVMQLCDDLHGAYPTVTLKSTGEAGDVLSIYGDAYFKSVIPGLQTLCPPLFFVQSYVPSKIPVQAYDMTGGNPYSARLQGKDIMRGFNRMGGLLGGLTGAFLAGLVTFVLCVIACVFSQRKLGEIYPGIVASSLVIGCSALLVGQMVYTLTMILGLIAGIGIAFVLHLKRA